MAILDYQTLMLPVLVAASDGELRISEAVEKLAGKFGLTQEERAELLSSGMQTIFSNRVHWAKTYLVKAELVEIMRRGYFKITPRGIETLAKNPVRIDNAFLSQFDSFEKFRRKSASENAPAPIAAAPSFAVLPQTPDETMRSAHRQIETALAQELLDRIRRAPPDFFERLIVNLLLKLGYGGSLANAGRALGRSGDDGVDGVIDQDILGLDRVYIQAKRYAPGNTIGAGAIRDFFGSLDRHKAAKGIFVTTSAFSAPAVETAQFLSKRIVLIDGDELAELMIRQGVGCRVEDTLRIMRVDEDFFE